MKAIHKYKLDIIDHQRIILPVNAKILTIQIQDSQVCLWAEIDTEIKMQEALIECFGTGHEIHEDMGIDRFYIDTVQKDGFVWHFYRRTN